MKYILYLLLLSLSPMIIADESGEKTTATVRQTPYAEDQKVIFDFFFNHPHKINTGLDWLRVYMNTLMDSPYDQAPEFMSIKVMIHGAEILTLVGNNYEKYTRAVQRMRYFESLGVEFMACHSFATELGYQPSDFYDFVTLVPAAHNELIHWQSNGYTLMTPLAQNKLLSREELRKPQPVSDAKK